MEGGRERRDGGGGGEGEGGGEVGGERGGERGEERGGGVVIKVGLGFRATILCKPLGRSWGYGSPYRYRIEK